MTEKSEKKIKCVVLRDFWPEADQRVHAGTVMEFTPEQAMDGVEAGLLSRVKDEK
jgi:hypothetical protein